MTGRQRWEVGEHLVDTSEVIICSFHTASLHSSGFRSAPFVRSCFFFFIFFSTSVPSICLKGSRVPFLLVFFVCFVFSRV